MGAQLLRRAATGLQLVRRGRLLQAAGKVVPPSLFYYTDRYITRCRKVVELPRTLSHIRVRWAGPEDAAALERLHPGRSGHLDRFASGFRCILGEFNGAPASVHWLSMGEWHESRSNGFRFRLRTDACWCFGLFVHPRFRHTGLFHKHWSESMRLLAGEGIRIWYATVERHNELARRSFQGLGCEEIYRYRVFRLAGVIFHSARPAGGIGGPSSAGWGRWVGGDPG